MSSVWALLLDVDGVICKPHGRGEDVYLQKKRLFPGSSDLSLLERRIVWANLLDRQAVGHLHDLIRRISEVAEVRIILSSSWRIGLTVEELREVFSGWEFSRYLVDKTPGDGSYDRWWEIQQWISENGQRHRIEKFVIIDDCLFRFPKGHFVEVDADVLFTEENAREAWDKFQDQTSLPIRKKEMSGSL